MPKTSRFSQPLFAILILLISTSFVPIAQAQTDYVKVYRKLSDTEFYRLVTCGAPPGGECRIKPAKWSSRDVANLTVRITKADNGFPRRGKKIAQTSVERAVREINNTGSSVKIKHIESGTPDISIELVDTDERPIMPLTGNWAQDVHRINVGAYYSPFLKGNRIVKCDIAVSNLLDHGVMHSIILEEMVQCLGLRFDVWGKAYRNRSIFSERSNRTKRLVKQDAAIIRLHYPSGG